MPNGWPCCQLARLTESISTPFINQEETTLFLAMVDYRLHSGIVDLLQEVVNDQKIGSSNSGNT